MDIKIIVFLLTFLLSCAGAGIKNGGSGGPCATVSPMDNLAPHIGKCIIMKGTVTETGYPSISDYWIPVPELERYRGQDVTLKGTLVTRKESAGESSSGRGVYFIKVIEITPGK
ncbi:MAG TPA: hypothetical protein PK358_13510 [Spirochaetota bacterium]|nr:hypothetical protein [Spirochaetota bacterium]